MNAPAGIFFAASVAGHIATLAIIAHIHVAPGAMETAMAPLGAGPTPGPELAPSISNCAIALEQIILQGGIRTAPTP